MSGQARPNATLLVVLGPTGTGKSAAAVEVARLLRGEIVGCDAYQVYRGLDAATGKPPAEDRRAVPHHLVDCVDPRTDLSMADYVRAAERAIATIVGGGRLPLVVGGNGLYLRGLLRGVIEAPARDPELRARLHRIIDKGGASRLWTWLGRHDPETAHRLRPGDVQRLVRAIELARSDGANWSERLKRAGTWASGRERYRTLKIGLDGGGHADVDRQSDESEQYRTHDHEGDHRDAAASRWGKPSEHWRAPSSGIPNGISDRSGGATVRRHLCGLNALRPSLATGLPWFDYFS